MYPFKLTFTIQVVGDTKVKERRGLHIQLSLLHFS